MECTRGGRRVHMEEILHTERSTHRREYTRWSVQMEECTH